MRHSSSTRPERGYIAYCLSRKFGWHRELTTNGQGLVAGGGGSNDDTAILKRRFSQQWLRGVLRVPFPYIPGGCINLDEGRGTGEVHQQILEDLTRHWIRRRRHRAVLPRSMAHQQQQNQWYRIRIHWRENSEQSTWNWNDDHYNLSNVQSKSRRGDLLQSTSDEVTAPMV